MNITESFDKESLIAQAKKVKKKSSSGIDGVSAKEAVSVANNEHKSMIEEILNGHYQPMPIIKVEIPKADGRMRTIGSASARDRIIQGCIAEYLNKQLDEKMSKTSFGFRTDKNCHMAIKKMIETVEAGYGWIISLDLQECFNHIDHDRILWLLRQNGINNNIIKDINNIINNHYSCKSQLQQVQGCPQGSNVSPIICNLVLNELDMRLEEQGHPFIRYADDIYIFCKSKRAAVRIKESVVGFITKNLKLMVNEEKTRIIDTKNNSWCCLGFILSCENDEIHIRVDSSKVYKARNKIKGIIGSESENVVARINEITRGWINYYGIAEISLTMKNLDAFIKRELNKAERCKRIAIDRKALVCCHDYYRKMGHQLQVKNNNMPEKDGRHENTENQENSENQQQKDTAVSLLVRAPPISGTNK